MSTCDNRKVHEVNFESKDIEFEESDETSEERTDEIVSSKAMKWHRRLGHASRKYLLEFAKLNPNVLTEEDIKSENKIEECEICMITKCVKLPFSSSRVRAEKPLQVIHTDTMGPISPQSHPSGYKFVVIFVDDYSRVALAYPMKHKSEVPENLKACVASMRNIINSDNKVCYLRTDQGTEFVCKETIKVLKEINGNNTAGAELQLACPDTPEHNGVAERFNRTLETKVRSMMYDSGLPPTMWDLAVKTAVYVYNRTPHRSIDMKMPLTVLAPNFRLDLNQLKRFGCVSIFKIPRNSNVKFGEQALRGFMVGYKPTGFIIYMFPRKINCTKVDMGSF